MQGIYAFYVLIENVETFKANTPPPRASRFPCLYMTRAKIIEKT